MTNTQPQHPAATQPTGNPWKTLSIILITVLITLGVGYWLVRVHLFPEAFTPVVLNSEEQQQLNRKLRQLGIDPAALGSGSAGTSSGAAARPVLVPEPYSEVGASRDVNFTEKELNAILAKNTDLASKLAIDLSDNLASAKLLLHLDPEMPFFGGKTIVITAGIELAINNGQPRSVLKGVSLWGVPLPNAWLGNLKNVDLIEEFGDNGGFWQGVREGVEEFEISDGKLHIRLKE